MCAGQLCMKSSLVMNATWNETLLASLALACNKSVKARLRDAMHKAGNISNQ